MLGLILVALASTACSSDSASTLGKNGLVPSTATSEPTQTAATPAPTAQERQWSFRGQRGITAAFVPTDLALYRSLLPAAFDMPDSPLVAVAVVNYYDVTLPLTPYSEGYVVMQCKYKGRTGWYVLTMPVDDEVANAGGRALGFPKYVADKIDLAQAEGGVWSGGVSHERRDVMRVNIHAESRRAARRRQRHRPRPACLSPRAARRGAAGQ